MRVLVLGATGMAGHTISLYLAEAGHKVTGFSRRPFSYFENITGDITNFELVKSLIDNGGFDAVVNAVGILNKDAEEHNANAVLLNSYLPHYLSEISKDMKTKIIHMSTDCVFSGRNGRYTENALKDGQVFYDRSKALGEIENDKDLTFRNSIIGPDTDEDGIGLFNWFMRQHGQINGFTKAIWTGVTTLTLAKAIEKAIEQDLTGLYHLVNNQPISKFDLLKLINKLVRDDVVTILPNDSVVIDKSLLNTRLDFLFEVPSYEAMIKEMKAWIDNHKNLYRHYT